MGVLSEMHPDPLAPLLNRSATFIEPGSTTFRILEFLLAHPEGLGSAEILASLQFPKGTFSMAITQLLVHKEALKGLGLEFFVDKTNPRNFVYRVRLTTSTPNSVDLITDAMRKKTNADLTTFLSHDRGLSSPLSVAQAVPRNATGLIANATWAFPQEVGTYACIKEIMGAASEGRFLTVQELRTRHACLKGNYAFVHKCEQTSFRYAPELGFVIRCLTELPRGRVGGFFLNPIERGVIARGDCNKSFHFDRVHQPNLETTKRRIRNLKTSEVQVDFDKLDEQLLLAVVTAQDKNEYYTSHQWADQLDIPRSTLFRRIQKSIENRASWKIYLRTRAPGVGGVEACYYDGTQP